MWKFVRIRAHVLFCLFFFDSSEMRWDSRAARTAFCSAVVSGVRVVVIEEQGA